MSAIIHQFNSSNRSTGKDLGDNLKPLISQIANCLNEELSELIGRLFDGADDMLFQLAENADSNEDQNQYFDTMRMLRAERKHIGQNFADNLKVYLQPSKKSNEQNSPLLEDELSLVDQDEMEEMVAVSAMHSKAMSLYGEAINHLEARIEFLALKASGIFNKDALAPKNICESFKEALNDIELSTNNKLVLYKLFDQEVILHLEPLYLKLNQLFIDQGILPQIKLGSALQTPKRNSPTLPEEDEANIETDAVYRENPTYNPGQTSTYSQHSQQQSSGVGNYNQVAPGANIGANTNTGTNIGASGGASGGPSAGPQQNTVANNNYPGSHGAQSSQNSPASQDSPGGTHNEVHRVVSQFINGELTASGPGIPASFTTAGNAASAAGMQFYDRRDVMHALNNLQHNVAQSDTAIEQIDAADFKRALLADMGSRNGGAITKQVNQVDEKTIDFIEMLFDAIIEDISISEPVTNLLLRLQIPVIKVAMLDKNFFADGQHPCRTTLNLIAHLGRGLTSTDDSLFTALTSVVEALLNDFDIDNSSFETAETQLEAIELEEIQKSAEKEKITQKSVLQKHAREVVLAELQYHVMDKVLPKAAQNLVLKNWSTLMFHRYIKFGKNSDDWHDAVTSVNKMIQLLQPIESTQAHNKLNTEKDTIIDVFHNELLNTKQNPVEIETEINNVYLNFEEMLEKSSFSPENIASNNTYFVSVEEELENNSEYQTELLSEPELEIEAEIIDPLLEQSNIAREKIAQLPREVRPGVWFKVYNGEDSAARRVKLSVIIMEEAKLIFVDRIGVKVIEKDAEIFTDELADDHSQIIADHSAFDHALGMVISSLST